MTGISIVFPHKEGVENNRLLQLNKRLYKRTTRHPYEIINVVGGGPHIVYPSFNFLVKQAKYDIVVMANSDITFAQGWDEMLVKHIDEGDWFSFRLVECGAIGSDQIVEDFGRTAKSFDFNAFQTFVNEQRNEEIENGFVWYVPCAWKKEYFLSMGGFDEYPPFPEANDIKFREKCAAHGARFKILDSWAYHFQRAGENSGEKPERI